MASIPVCMAPDPNTRTPKYRPPPGACDAHCHIFGPGDRYPYAEDRSYTPPDAPLERFVELQKTHRCIYCVVDLHAITMPQKPAELKSSIREVTAAFIAAVLKWLICDKEDVP